MTDDGREVRRRCSDGLASKSSGGTHGRVGVIEVEEELLVGEGGHVLVGPGVVGNVVLKLIECTHEFLWVVEDVDADEEMRGMDVVLLQEVVQRVRRLKPKSTLSSQR